MEENKAEEIASPNEVEDKIEETQDELEVVEEVIDNKGSSEKDDEDIQDKDNSNQTKNETKKKDKDNLYEEIEIPEGISSNLDDDFLIVKKDDKELRRKLVSLIDVKVEGNKIVISAMRNRKIERKLFGTFKAHIRNMVKGLEEGFEYKLKIANVHFPMNVSYDENKKELVVKNFLGEKKDRIITLLDEVNVKVDNEEILIDSYDIEKAGQVATRIEKGTKVRNKDRRVYQDGIFIIEKPGRVYL